MDTELPIDRLAEPVPFTRYNSNIPFTVEDLNVEQLIEDALTFQEGVISEEGALVVDTGQFTGRSPKDRFVVRDEITEMDIWWGDVNIPIDTEHFEGLFARMKRMMSGMRIYRRQSTVCANPEFKLNLDIYTEHAFLDLFVHNLFLPSSDFEPLPWKSRWTIISLPSFQADPALDGTRGKNFTILNFSKRMILIGGTAYTGEIKKAVFSVLNFLLPNKDVLPLHCSVNLGKDGDTAMFFGLSGTGKTSLSADPERSLVGDDEHGWAPGSVFNIEGGCYAKCFGLEAAKEPQIFQAIQKGTLVENVKFYEGSTKIDFFNASKTENTRAAYPLSFIGNAQMPSITADPVNLFFLTADAFGVLPPIARLSPEQAVYYFLSGYTAKVAGTETGINEPEATFSACFGKAFLTRHPGVYSKMLEKKILTVKPAIWLINTGWTGGPYGKGKRIAIAETRAMIHAVLSGVLNGAAYSSSPGFGLAVPVQVPGVNSALLDARSTWADPQAYDRQLHQLINLFNRNFEKYEAFVKPEIVKSAPKND